MSKVKCQKVFVGLSGGVDSSVATALLQERGFEVTGVFIKVWAPDFIECTWKQDRQDAMRVCAKLNLPFKTLDLEKEYKREVVDYMVREYRAGRVPNPDVMCNQYVKFGAFFDWAIKQGANYVATGHYTRVASDATRKLQVTSYKLQVARDSAKDQSYFLWTLTQKQLSRTLFPIGEIKNKQEVRELAEKFGLPTAKKKDSQGLCFIGKINVKEFLKHFIREKSGHVLSLDGEVIGVHPGASFFTLGERHGFDVTRKTPNDRPNFIVAKNVRKNTLTVASEIPEMAKTKTITLEHCNWISGTPSPQGHFSAVLRYHGEPVGCRIICQSKKLAKVALDISVLSSAGQSLVVFNGEICLGGGIIK